MNAEKDNGSLDKTSPFLPKDEQRHMHTQMVETDEQMTAAPSPAAVADALTAAPASPVIETVDVPEDEERPTLAAIHSSMFRFCSNFAKIVNRVDPKHPKKVLQAIASKTRITNNLLKGIHSGKFVPSIKEALKIAAVLNANVENIWYLVPPQPDQSKDANG